MPVSVLTAKTRKRKATKILPDNTKEVHSIVKCGLFKQCKDALVFSAIQRDVEAISALTIEVSIYMHYKLYKDWASDVYEKIKFLDYFYALKKGSNSKFDLDHEYKSIRGRQLKDTPDGSNRLNWFYFAARQYETIFVNNIWIHAYKRLRTFLNRFEEDKKAVYETLGFLDAKDSKNTPNATLLQNDKGSPGSRWKIRLSKSPFMNNLISLLEDIEEIQGLLAKEHFDYYIELDSGERLIVGGIRICDSRTQNIQIKSSTFHYISSFYAQKSQRNKPLYKMEKARHSDACMATFKPKNKNKKN